MGETICRACQLSNSDATYYVIKGKDGRLVSFLNVEIDVEEFKDRFVVVKMTGKELSEAIRNYA